MRGEEILLKKEKKYPRSYNVFCPSLLSSVCYFISKNLFFFPSEHVSLFFLLRSMCLCFNYASILHIFGQHLCSPKNLMLPADHACFAHRSIEPDVRHMAGALGNAPVSRWLCGSLTPWSCVGRSWSPAGESAPGSLISGSRK